MLLHPKKINQNYCTMGLLYIVIYCYVHCYFTASASPHQAHSSAKQPPHRPRSDRCWPDSARCCSNCSSLHDCHRCSTPSRSMERPNTQTRETVGTIWYRTGLAYPRLRLRLRASSFRIGRVSGTGHSSSGRTLCDD